MIRQKSKKTFEGPYISVPPPTSLAGTTRFDEDFFQNSKTNKNNKITEKNDVCIHNTVTSRKKSKARNLVEKKDQKTLVNQETVLERCGKIDGHGTKTKFSEEKEKDEDTEEFFVMIKETVERAVEKSLQDMIARSLRDIIMQLDEIRERVNTTANSLEKIQAELINKIIHYGEENSRHFRYLCMKSEYDKMFYQHQSAMTAFPVDPRLNLNNSYPQHLTSHIEDQTTHRTKQPPQRIQPQKKIISNPPNSSILPTDFNSNDFTDFDCAQRSKLSVSSKSSDMGIREVKDLLEQLQKFYDHHNHEKEDKKEEDVTRTLTIPDQDDSADGDEDDESSDDMTSPSIEENIGPGGDS